MVGEIPQIGDPHPLGPQEMQRKFVSVDEELLRKSLACADLSVEFAQELLAVHDENLGRTTTKNRLWAEHLEDCIRMAKATVIELREALGFTEPTG
jgi:hypothetical protein